MRPYPSIHFAFAKYSALKALRKKKDNFNSFARDFFEKNYAPVAQLDRVPDFDSDG